MLIELSDIVELSRDPEHLQLGVYIVIPLRKIALMLVVKVWSKTKWEEGRVSFC